VPIYVAPQQGNNEGGKYLLPSDSITVSSKTKNRIKDQLSPNSISTPPSLGDEIFDYVKDLIEGKLEDVLSAKLANKIFSIFSNGLHLAKNAENLANRISGVLDFVGGLFDGKDPIISSINAFINSGINKIFETLGEEWGETFAEIGFEFGVSSFNLGLAALLATVGGILGGLLAWFLSTRVDEIVDDWVDDEVEIDAE
jgi:hypothetical protein